MTTNDTLVLHLIKHLVRKSEETNLAELLGEPTIAIGKETSTDSQTKFASKLLGQLGKIEDTLAGLRQQVQTWVNPTLTANLVQANGTHTIPAKNNGVVASNTLPKNYPNWLLQPIQALQKQLPNSAFIANQPYTTSFHTETKDKNIYFYAFALPEADTTGELLSFLHHQLNRHLLVESQVDLLEALAGLDRTVMMHTAELDYLAQASQAKFVIGKIDKAQAILSFVHSGLVINQIHEDALQTVPFQNIQLGQRDNHTPQIYSLPIKRNMQFHITTPQDKTTIEEFAKKCPSLPAKQQIAWWEQQFADKQGNPKMLLSFGF